MAPMTGHVTGQGLGRLMSLGIGTEILYAFIIIACSLMIYFSTRELYKLTSHKGIKYFRLAFLFFALAYFFRSFIKIILFYFDKSELLTFLPIFGAATLFIFMYFSSMAIFYLLYSVMWKSWKSKSTIYILHAAALLTATIVLQCHDATAYLAINIILFAFITFTVYSSYHQSKNKKSQNLYIIYLMLFVFWILNIIDILVPSFLQTYQLLIYLASSGIFLLIFYKVIKKTG